MYQIGYYKQSGEEIIWKDSSNKRLSQLRNEADEWVKQFEDSEPWSMVLIAKEGAETVTLLRYLDDTEWIVSGKGSATGEKHCMVY
jgi:hypothetical protein